MKAPVTTHDLLLLAESKLSCTNVRNCDKRTQTTGIFVVITMRINHGEYLSKHLGAHPWSSVLQTIQSYLCTTLTGGAEREVRGKEKRKRHKD